MIQLLAIITFYLAIQLQTKNPDDDKAVKKTLDIFLKAFVKEILY